MKKISLVLVALIVIISSCKKDDQNSGQINVNPNSKSSGVNPYDEVGIFHNNALYALAEMPNFPKVSSKDAGNFLLSYCHNSAIFCPEHDGNLNYYDSVAHLMGENQSIKGLAENLFMEKKIDEIQYSYLKKLDYILVSNVKDNKLLNIKIDEIEAVFKSENRISEENKILIWGAFSVARYSANFWHDADVNSNNPWHVFFVNSNSKEPHPVYNGTEIGRITADAAGWVHGLFGTCTGKRLHCARVASVNASRLYVAEHTEWVE